MEKLKYVPSGDNGVLIVFGNEINVDINNKIRSFTHLLYMEQDYFSEITELIPAYTSVLLMYNPLKINYSTMINKLKELEKKSGGIILPPPDVVHIPVVYGGDFGPDLKNVSDHCGLSIEEVITIHSTTNYLIYMIGFTPGFPYLGGMSERIATPRLKIPREKILTGSVGIAGNQTGVYPIESPGGWQIIGRTPLKIFNPETEPYVLLKAGQYIKFEPINMNDYLKIEREIEDGLYQVKCTMKGSD
ncbi:5-oxoprolinase subunit PxpB [Alkaliphilus peptidifermentans]|uniref:Sensor histidine kinase inhibitor, KipI family n=1 Tax=Alkaliphilus peptidifermentans DSM 18978 TaxID=1120976 RepID=A0A1G5JYQ8_9FIRM|nr:5-oxoprolinase subunit PxpB [Alkaliphilus peptidifermentans]SCY93456.1 sensor histidine kinase inhibitor, KipI family [Alkaliphilus peptidifermentans DSM 18978]